ncbi:MAG: hypothetical protein DRP56_04560 [Planctomycetota bacterium]|nr:MAG: hypothetical protein DRP56_04560 [Planctomycetota bacterium]
MNRWLATIVMIFWILFGLAGGVYFLWTQYTLTGLVEENAALRRRIDMLAEAGWMLENELVKCRLGGTWPHMRGEEKHESKDE